MFEDFEGNLWYFPLDESFTTALYGTYPNTNLMHTGIDFNSKYKKRCLNKPVYSIGDNLKVIHICTNETDRYGHHVILFDESKILYILLGHLNKIYVELNQIVDHNTIIGTVGLTGWCNVENTGHVHLEFRKTLNIRRCTINPARNIELHKLYIRKENSNDNF